MRIYRPPERALRHHVKTVPADAGRPHADDKLTIGVEPVHVDLRQVDGPRDERLPLPVAAAAENLEVVRLSLYSTRYRGTPFSSTTQSRVKPELSSTSSTSLFLGFIE